MMQLNGTPASRAAFLHWMKTREPRVYALVMAQGNALGDWTDTISNIFTKVTDTVAKLAPTYIETKAQLELLKLNIARAKAGQMPVTSLPGAAGSGGGNVVATQPQGGSFMDSLPSWAIPAAIGVALLLFMRR